MRVFIVGQKWLGAEVLQLCLRRGDHVLGVCAPEHADEERTRPDRLWCDAIDAGVPRIAAEALRDESIPLGTDLIVCAHAHVFITAGMRERATHGAIGYHPSLLPLHRGRDAVRWAIHMREPVTGGTVYWMDDTADGGPIAAQDTCFIRRDDTPETLWRRELAPMGLRLIAAVLADVEAGRIVRVEQDDGLATWEPSFRRQPLRAAPLRPKPRTMGRRAPQAIGCPARRAVA